MILNYTTGKSQEIPNFIKYFYLKNLTLNTVPFDAKKHQGK